MAADLKDARYKVTALAWCYIEAEHRATGKDQSEIAREVLHTWAEQKHRASIEAQKLLRSEGLNGKAEGIVGKSEE